jgi:NAD(P)-dependent dehydrogenase (short-subunit alcohol dehydrogenase family)
MGLFTVPSAVAESSGDPPPPQPPHPKERNTVLIFGASGAIGKQLVHAVTAKHGAGSVVAALRKTPLPPSLTHHHGQSNNEELVAVELGVDLRDAESVERVVAKHASQIRAVWNLAAPLSVETEADPQVVVAVLTFSSV